MQASLALALALPAAATAAGSWDVYPLAFPASNPFSQPPTWVPRTSNRTLAACAAACTEASGCQGFAACSMGPVGCWTYHNITSGQLNHSLDCDWHAPPWSPAPTVPLPLCNLDGNWSSAAANYTTHIEFFQPQGSRNFTLRSGSWPVVSYGSVGPQSDTAFWLMVGDAQQTVHRVTASPLVPDAPPCTYIEQLGWCRFPHGCPVPQPTTWAPWPPAKPAPPMPREPLPPPAAGPSTPPVMQSCAATTDNNPCPLPKWDPVWDLARSTNIQPCNFSGFYNSTFAAKWGLVAFDWSNDRADWQGPLDDQERLVEQCRMVKKLNPLTRCFVSLSLYQRKRSGPFNLLLRHSKLTD